MRIVHVITRMIVGGAQENTLLNCRDLQEQYGDEVLLLTGPERGPEGDLLALSESHVPVQIVPHLQREIAPFSDLQAYREVRAALRAFAPDVVHTHSAKAGIVGRAAAWSLGVPAIVHTVHGAPFYAEQSRLAWWFSWACERWAARRCHKLIGVAQAMCEQIVAAGIAPREKCCTIYSGMETEPLLSSHEHRSALRSQLAWPEELVVLGVIARLAPLKGHADLLAAVRPLLERLPQLRLLLVGDGPLRAQLMSTVESWGLGDRIHWAGLVAPTEIPRYLSAMDIVAHTSLREGLPRALPQALLSGKPIVSYDIDGAREVCIDGETGRLLAPHDRRALTAALEELITNAPLRAMYGEAGRERVRHAFAHRTTSAQIRAVYLEVLQQQAASPH